MRWKLPEKKGSKEREFEDLVSVGPAIRDQLVSLGVRTVKDLARRDPEALYQKLCLKTKSRVDPCVLDVYRAAVAQARNPDLPAEQRLWWYWSRVRKDSPTREPRGARIKKR